MGDVAENPVLAGVELEPPSVSPPPTKLAPHVQAAQDVIRSHLTEMMDLFVYGTKVTFIARVPGNDEGDVVVSMDSLEEIGNLIQRRRGAASG